MNIEVVEFYPSINKKPSPLIGTLHVYLCDVDIDIRGIPVYRTSNNFFISMPRGKGIDSETGNKVDYPIINFTDPRKQRALIKEIRKLAFPYIQDHIKQVKAA